MNNFSGIGRVAMDAKVGNGVLTSLLAIKRIYKSSDKIDTDFIPITLFGHQAENFDRLTKKGDKIGIDGSIKTSKYADENGEVHYGWSVVVNHFYLLSSKPKDSAGTLSDSTVNSISTKLDGLVKDSDLPF
ncbi:single-stranded DNA-binding protein [Lacticaseibacillus paracasei]|uniref:single-stranded DNA-binding protein n=1 Tax=Lacticaseibacillus paracasei TaxID=1597 RepID=UPI00137739B8|nr:single-stranded DNA-binding protein [Lacticaseibacillus paracasei]MCZ2766180.1 single-stranded DNA-binding protein [Lacticaseibacillus paracasei]MCZ2769109.1 single-stranded DNA-binding protein [Lacticaseibacillus paracasei]MCZ2774618.1 single-stranded DNA-binding protein [Lacticaseibacillus paracasei]MCZ2777574.1 single-stranded DNA-binding protein [Lacticaseibacillus paracasei]MCZ2783651.1 single-stranded DNA-binding protein [Lacticaseibacillus paracasei]